MMKKLIRFALVIVVLAVFAFSNNPTIEKARIGVKAKVTELLDKGDKAYDEKEAELLNKLDEKISEVKIIE